MIRLPWTTSVLLLPFIAITFFANSEFSVASQDEANGETVVEIRTKSLPASQMVFVRHDGPYWRLSSTIESLIAYMKQHQQDGPILIRYEGHPQSRQFSSQIRVGFNMHGDLEPESPYELVQHQAGLVVYATISAGSLSPSRSYGHLSDWALQNGFEIVGPFMEIYSLPRTHESSEIATVEVQLVVREKSSLPQLDIHPISKPLDAAIEIDSEPIDEPVTTVISTPEKFQQDAGSVVMPPSRIAEDIVVKVDHTTESIGHLKSTKLKKPMSAPVLALHKNDQSVLRDQDVITVFEPVIDLLFSTLSRGHDESHAPLAKLISRVHAIAQGADQRYPGQALPLLHLAEMMRSKFAAYKLKLADGLDISQTRIAEPSDRIKRLHQATKQLETVMVGVGYRTMSASQALVRVLTIIRGTVEDHTNAPNSPSDSSETP